ncbi:MAG: RsbRD N-terminal domain-containing protein [Terriglobia bacterium]|nr:RsbRD N-terminal domain-containing protein [Terriglobia bacterium]
MQADAIVEPWFARTVELYPELTARFLTAEEDPFRNPVGHALRQSLATLANELVGEMDKEKIAAALDDIVRIRAVQDFSPSEAVGFIFLAKPIIRRLTTSDYDFFDRRIDELVLLAFNAYMRCREQLADVRIHEAQRALGRYWHPEQG